MDTHRHQAYLTLISALLECPRGEEEGILNSNSALVDSGLVEAMLGVADHLFRNGNQQAANFLRNLTSHLMQQLNLTKMPFAQPTSEESLNFLLHVLQATQDSDGSEQVVYPLLQENLSKLNDSLAQQLDHWTAVKLSQLEQGQAESFGWVLWQFSELLMGFPLGNKASKLEIVLTSNAIAATIFQPNAFPLLWARIHQQLGYVYRNRVRGDQAENLEKAITAYQTALQYLTHERFPEIWAIVQNDIGNAYCNRIQGNRAENLDRAITAYQAALGVFTCEVNPENWALTQYHLALTYSERINGDRSQNLERAIAACEAALRVFTSEAFPEMWKQTRALLMITYGEQARMGQNQNLDRLAELTGVGENFRFLEQILRATESSGGNPQVVYPILAANIEKLNQDFAFRLRDYVGDLLSQRAPEQAQRGAEILGNFSLLMSRFPLGSRLNNLEIAISGFETALTVFTRETCSECWAKTKANLADAYTKRIEGDRVQNIETALNNHQLKLVG